MEIDFNKIVKYYFGEIREVIYNNLAKTHLVETEHGYQFVINNESKIIFDNVNSRFKIITNTFGQKHILMIVNNGLYKFDSEYFAQEYSFSFDIWGNFQYESLLISDLQFPFLQYFSAIIHSLDNNNLLILVDDQIGLSIYNIQNKKVEFVLNPKINKEIASVWNKEIYNLIYWGGIDKFEISNDEEYFYIITAYEGKSLFVFRKSDYGLIYHEIGSYAISFGIFYKDYFIIPSGYDYDVNDKQPFRIVNLKNGVVNIIDNNEEFFKEYSYGFNYNGIFVGKCNIYDKEFSNSQICIKCIDLDVLVSTNTIKIVDIVINPDFNFTNISGNVIYSINNKLYNVTRDNIIYVCNLDELIHSQMEELIKQIFFLIKDYRIDENNPDVQMSEDRIRNWIIQFDEPLRIPILKELKNIFEKRYCSKNKVKILLEKVVIKLTEDFSFQTPQNFLRNSIFLNLQPEGKSQRIMLNLFNELISEKYGISLENCGTISKRYSIYIDDILCTGLTLFNDIKEWSGQNFSLGKTNLQAISDDSTTLVFVYVFIHNKNYHKKIAEMRHKISNEISLKHKMYRHVEIENEIGIFSKMDLILPLESGEIQSVINYKDSITNEVDIYTQRYNRISPNEFYRPTGLPSNETFFTNSEYRKLVEDAFLLKGIEILKNANAINKNIRALGYSIPSLKNFGFGALCYTWRNIPNNAPLVFWYSGGGFFPLFKVTRGSTTFVDLTLLDNQTQIQNEDLPF